MPRFKLEIDCGNDAFYSDTEIVDSSELIRILEDTIEGVRSGQIAKPLQDYNGHTVGNWEIIAD